MVYLYTEFANSKTELEPQGGELLSAKLDENLFGVYLYTEFAYSELEPQRRRPYRALRLTNSTSDCAVLLRSRHTKRSGIMRARYLSMRVP